MGSRGHPLAWRVRNGDDRAFHLHSPTRSGGLARTAGRGADRSTRPRAEVSLAPSLLSRRSTGTVDELDQLGRRRHPHDLMVGADPHRSRRAILLGVRQPDHGSSPGGRLRSVGDHRHVIAVVLLSVIVWIDHGDVSPCRVEQPAEDGRKQPRSHRDEHLEWWLR